MIKFILVFSDSLVTEPNQTGVSVPTTEQTSGTQSDGGPQSQSGPVQTLLPIN